MKGAILGVVHPIVKHGESVSIAPSPHPYGRILAMCTSSNVSPRKEMLFGGRVDTAPYLG